MMRILLALLLLVSCTSVEPLERRTLPFHIAIVPMEEPTVGAVSSGELPGKQTAMRLELSQDEITEAVRGALREYCFSAVTVLAREDFEQTADAFERQRLALEQARDVGADLLIELDLRYDPEIYREKSPTFWLNYPLFLFAGPANWFIGDQRYFADAELTTTVFDRHVMEAGNMSIGDPAARVVAASSRYTQTELDFTDRSDGIKHYVSGFLIPSGFLGRESESTQQEIHAKVIADLRTQVVQGIQSRRRELLRAEWISPVFLDPGQVQMRRDGNDVVVAGSVQLREGGLAERVHRIVLSVGTEAVAVEPTDAPTAGEPGYRALRFEARVPVDPGAETLRIECEAGSRDRFIRSYTFGLPK